MSVPINIGFVPLTDAAPLIIAHEMGFAREEGLSLNLSRELNWSTVRDKLGFGILDGAHLLLPLALSLSLGAGPVFCEIDIAMIMNMNGNALVVNHQLANALKVAGCQTGDARSFAKTMIKLTANGPVRIGVPYMDSMHVTMLRHLILRLGERPENVFEFHVSSPSAIESLLKSGDVDAFMVGAPWGARAVENDTGCLILSSNSIWQGAPEKVLGLRRDWVNENEELSVRLTRAVYRAANWVANRSNASVASEILTRFEYLDMDAALIEHNLRGEVVVSSSGTTIFDPLAIQFDANRIGFPWHSSIGWVAEQNAAFWKIDKSVARQLSTECCRTDLYRKALESIYGPVPSANAKLEGSLAELTPVSGSNDPILGPDAFFDGEIYDLA